MIPGPSPARQRRSAVRFVNRLSAVLLVAAGVASCTDYPVAPSRPLVKSAPSFSVTTTIDGYSVTEITAPGTVFVTGISAVGDVGGWYVDEGTSRRRASIWRGPEATLDLLTPDGAGMVFGMSPNGTAAGLVPDLYGETVPAIWPADGSPRRELAVLYDQTEYPQVNDALDVVGNSFLSGVGRRATLWPKAGEPRDLGSLAGTSSSWAMDINANGDIAGYSGSIFDATVFIATVWLEGGAPQALEPLADGNSCNAFAINDARDVAGVCYEDLERHPVLWVGAAGSPRKLGRLGEYSIPGAMNNAGTIVGYSRTTGGENVATIWPAGGAPRFLPGFEKSVARAINDAGQVAGDGWNGTLQVGIRWTPILSNAPPAVGPVVVSASLVPVNTAVTASASFTDAETGDTHTSTIAWGDGTSSAATVTESNGSGSVTGTHSYTAAGVYPVTVSVSDGTSTASSVFQYVVVYDPSAGFVTGAGWINSPAGAYPASPTLIGRANFGFVSRYLKGATVPSGNTQFQFQVANFTFTSTSYDWLVIAGPSAKYKGSGKINGAGDFGFQLSAVDGAVNGGGGTDKFRIKIWNKSTDAVIYDNQAGSADDAEASTVIGGGSIVIHR